MAQISLLQFNHDHCPGRGDHLEFGYAIAQYMRTLDTDELPAGVLQIETHHSQDPSLLERMREALLDAAIMFENFERNRNLPGTAARGQYEAMGRSIRELLK